MADCRILWQVEGDQLEPDAHRVTFTQVGWLLHTPIPMLIPLSQNPYEGVSFSPVWVEGPND